jgi:hypothetical protein
MTEHDQSFQVRGRPCVAPLATAAADTIDDVQVSLSDVDATGVAVDDADTFAAEAAGCVCRAPGLLAQSRGQLVVALILDANGRTVQCQSVRTAAYLGPLQMV